AGTAPPDSPAPTRRPSRPLSPLHRQAVPRLRRRASPGGLAAADRPARSLSWLADARSASHDRPPAPRRLAHRQRGSLPLRCRPLLVLMLALALAAPASAGIIFGRKAKKPDPQTRVPELIATLKTDRDEGKRARAAEELTQFDPAAFPDLVPALIGALL